MNTISDDTATNTTETTETVTGPLTGRKLDAKSGKPVDQKVKAKPVLKLPASKKEASKKEAPKKAAKAPEKKVSKTSRDGNHSIKLLEKANPHRKGSKDFTKYAKLTGLPAHNRTVSNAVAAKVDRGYLRYAKERGLIEIKAT